MEDPAPRKIAGGKTSVDELAALVEQIARLECRAAEACGGRADVVSTELPSPLDQIERGMLHEWLCGGDDEEHGRPWTAPILIFAHLAAIAARDDSSGGLLVWIGRRVWPQPHVLVGRAASPNELRGDLLNRSLLIDPRPLDDRLWAIDLCLRSPSVAAVISDASGMRMAQSRRLQLAAESGRALALLTRPWGEHKEHSAAARRWRIEPAPSPTSSPRWQIELVRCKGMQRGRRTDAAPGDNSGSASTLIVEHDHATHCLRAPADVADRSRAAEASPAESRASIRRTG